MKTQMRVADTTFDRFQARQGLTAKNQSQMSKIVPMLQVGSKKGPDEAQVVARLEARLTALREIRSQLEKSAVSLAKLYVVDKDRQLKKLTIARNKIKAIAASKPPVGVSAHLKTALNELTSLREGVFTGAATDKKTLTVLEVNAALDHVRGLIESTKKKIQAMKAEAATGTDDPLFHDDIAKIIEQTKRESKALPKLGNRPFVIGRVPIVPVPEKFLSKPKIAGVEISSIGEYVVLHNQLVLGINKQLLEVKNKDSGKSLQTSDWLAAANKIKRDIEKQTNHKYTFVSEKPYGALGGAWFWLMPDRELDMFAKAFSGHAVKLKRWGFGS